MAVGCGDRLPEIEWVRASPDSVPRGGVAYLRVRAQDPGRGELSYRWSAMHGSVAPDSGDSTVYFAPGLNVDDTVTVVVSNEQGLRAEGSVVIYVREGLCGGRPQLLIATGASLLVADSARVCYVEPADGRWEIRRMSVEGLDRDTIATRPHEVRRLAHYGEALYWLEREVSGDDPLWRVMTVDKSGGAPPAVVAEFPGRSAAVTDIAAGPGRAHVAWLETVPESGYVARVSSYPRAGGPGVERLALAGPVSEATVVRALAAVGDELFCLVGSNELSRVAVMRLPASGEPVRLVGPELLAPGTLAAGDGIAAVGEEVFWSERAQGRIGRVRRDGSGGEFIVPAGGDAQELDLFLASAGPAGAGARLFWTVPDDLRGMVLATRAVIADMDRGAGDITGLAENRQFVFFVKDDGSGSRMFRVQMP